MSVLILSNDFEGSLYMRIYAHYHRQHCTPQVFEHFGTLFMNNHNDKHPSLPEFKLSTSESWDTTELALGTDVVENKISKKFDWIFKYCLFVSH